MRLGSKSRAALLFYVSIIFVFLSVNLTRSIRTEDVNNDGIVNVIDLSLLGRAFNSNSSSVNWNPNADINNDSLVSNSDLSLLSRRYGKEIECTHLVPIDPYLTFPSGTYRWLDVADQAYSSSYRNVYNYSQATVEVAYVKSGSIFEGTLTSINLKPNFAYQLKLVGTPGTAENERIGLAGRWWQEEWSGSSWVNGQNLNNKGDGSSPNPNDLTYFQRRYTVDASSPTGYHYRYTGYLVFDYFITDNHGAVTLYFKTGDSCHVLWKTSQRSNTTDDGQVKTATFDPNRSEPAYDIDYPSSTVSVFGEWERLPMGGVNLQPGEYSCQVILTEESFHGSGGSLSGNWAGAVDANITFTVSY
jgi:hypothetical protein